MQHHHHRQRKHPNINQELITKQSSSTLIVLTEGDILSICEKLLSVCSDWSTLGLAFGVKAIQLMNIKDQYWDFKRRLTEVVGKRLQFNDPEHPMTWSYIYECLRSPILERNDVAKEIEGKVPIIIILCILGPFKLRGHNSPLPRYF